MVHDDFMIKHLQQDDNSSLSTCSCDPVSVVCFSTAKLFLCGLQEFNRASDGGPATTETKLSFSLLSMLQ